MQPSGAAVTRFTKTATETDPTTLLSKRISLVDNKVVSDGSACRMAEGKAEIVSGATAKELAHVIETLQPSNALALGVSEHSTARVVTAAKLKKLNRRAADGLPVIARTRDFIDYRPGPGWGLLDFDIKGMPAHVAGGIAAAGGPQQSLLSIAPGLAEAARVTRASTSSGLRRSDTGEPVQGSGGEHTYILVKDATDIDRALQVLHDRCWLHGKGWYLIGSAGQLLERSLVDSSVRFGERLCFEGPPEVVPPLVQDAAARAPIAHNGIAVDTRRAAPHLTAYEQARVAEAKQRARVELEPQAAIIRADADRGLADRISDRIGMPFVAALRNVSARHAGKLLPSIMLAFDHLGDVAVEEVLAEPDKYIGETLADPLEGAEYGRGKAIVLRSAKDPTRIFIHSFAHGRTLYDLVHDARTIHAAIEAADRNYAAAILSNLVAQAELEPDELTELIAATSAKTDGKVGVRAIQARLKVERIKRAQAAHAAEHDQASLTDHRLSHPLPPPDGELTPIVKLVDETLAADPTEEPPMRDVEGNIVEVCVREPWGLHRLTATGSNAEPLPEGQQALPPAPEPGLVTLAAVNVALLIEKHLRFETQPTDKSPGYAARLQRPYVDAVMSYGAGSLMPVARAIVTTPMVAKNGTVIAGVGLDRSTSLVYRIEPRLLSCIPRDEELTEEHVSKALHFLIDDWLVDVNTDVTGKLLILMRALQKIERVLLSQRPAWFVTAGKAGSGKTTVIAITTMAVDGRPASAAAWSENEEERRKALFAYQRQGISEINWDNIQRGAQISSSAIEKSLTILENSDRVLGESRNETLSADALQTFTGNNIGPKGDMVSRSFRIVINVDRPDPQNRPFAHPDPIEWTRQHRAEILRALYTILVYGCRRRPAGLVSKTRFKDWYDLCGWPVEHAASLIGVEIDCAALIAAGESKDSETCAAVTLLSELISTFGSKDFTAKDITALIEAGTPRPLDPPTHAEKEKAERLLDAFGELIGKPLRRYSPGTIAKLLNNRLMDLPTFIDDTTATLKGWVKDHQTRYFIKASTPPDGNNKPRVDSQPNRDDAPNGRDRGLTGDTGHTGDGNGCHEVQKDVYRQDGTFAPSFVAAGNFHHPDISPAERSPVSPVSPVCGSGQGTDAAVLAETDRLGCLAVTVRKHLSEDHQSTEIARPAPLTAADARNPGNSTETSKRPSSQIRLMILGVKAEHPDWSIDKIAKYVHQPKQRVQRALNGSADRRA
jgi:hypothetical protein